LCRFDRYDNDHTAEGLVDGGGRERLWFFTTTSVRFSWRRVRTIDRISYADPVLLA
jgi:hypothetical protein